jgi:hypothetical protein
VNLSAFFEEARPAMNKLPAIAIYNRKYLAPSETFIYRQIVGLKRYQPVVFTDKINRPDRFPLGDIPLVVSPRKNILERFAGFFMPHYGYLMPERKLVNTVILSIARNLLSLKI